MSALVNQIEQEIQAPELETACALVRGDEQAFKITSEFSTHNTIHNTQHDTQVNYWVIDCDVVELTAKLITEPGLTEKSAPTTESVF